MASVWLHERGDKFPRKIKGHLSEKSAISLFNQMTMNFKGRKRRVFDYEALLYETDEQYRSKEPAGSIFIEFCSPPSAPEPGQPHVKAERKA